MNIKKHEESGTLNDLYNKKYYSYEKMKEIIKYLFIRY